MDKRFSNPLSVIALFAGLAEAFAAYALIKLPGGTQEIFVYFVMGFPILLVLLFFATLNWNYNALYAPGDFADQRMYLESMKLKESIKKELAVAFPNTGDGAIASSINIDNFAEKLEGVVERATESTRKEQVLTRIAVSPATSGEISRELGLNTSYSYRLLSELNAEGKIVSSKHGRSTVWSLSPCGA